MQNLAAPQPASNSASNPLSIADAAASFLLKATGGSSSGSTAGSVEVVELCVRWFSAFAVSVGFVEALTSLYDNKDNWKIIAAVLLCWASIPLFLHTWRQHTGPDQLLLRFQILLATVLTLCREDRVSQLVNSNHRFAGKMRLKGVWFSLYVLLSLLSLNFKQTPERHLKFAVFSVGLQALVECLQFCFLVAKSEASKWVAIGVALFRLSLEAAMHAAVIMTLIRSERSDQSVERRTSLVQALIPGDEEARPDWVLVISVDRHDGLQQNGDKPLLFQCECCVEDQTFEIGEPNAVNKETKELKAVGELQGDGTGSANASIYRGPSKSVIWETAGTGAAGGSMKSVCKRTTSTKKVVAKEGEEFLFVVPNLFPPSRKGQTAVEDPMLQGSSQASAAGQNGECLMTPTPSASSTAPAPSKTFDRRCLKLKWRVWCETEDTSVSPKRDRRRRLSSTDDQLQEPVVDADLDLIGDQDSVGEACESVGRRRRTMEDSDLDAMVHDVGQCGEADDADEAPRCRGRARSRALDELDLDNLGGDDEPDVAHRGRARSQALDELDLPSQQEGFDCDDVPRGRGRARSQALDDLDLDVLSQENPVDDESLPRGRGRARSQAFDDEDLEPRPHDHGEEDNMPRGRGRARSEALDGLDDIPVLRSRDSFSMNASKKATKKDLGRPNRLRLLSSNTLPGHNSYSCIVATTLECAFSVQDPLPVDCGSELQSLDCRTPARRTTKTLLKSFSSDCVERRRSRSSSRSSFIQDALEGLEGSGRKWPSSGRLSVATASLGPTRLEFQLHEVEGADNQEVLFAPDGGSVRVPLLETGTGHGMTDEPRPSSVKPEAWMQFSVLAISIAQHNSGAPMGRGPMVVPTATTRARQKKRPKLLTFGSRVSKKEIEEYSPTSDASGVWPDSKEDDDEEHESDDGEAIASNYLSNFLEPPKAAPAPTLVVSCGPSRPAADTSAVEVEMTSRSSACSTPLLSAAAQAPGGSVRIAGAGADASV